MKQVLVFAPPGDWEREPAFRVRLLAMKDAMMRRGYEWHFRVRPKTPGGRIGLAWSVRRYDAVILYKRLLDAYEARLVRWRAAPPRRILLDVDYAVMYHETELGWLARRRLDRRFAATSAIVDRVCAGNRYLAEIFQKQGCAVTIVPTVVAPERYPVKRHEDSPIIRLSWIGSRTTRRFLEQAMGALNEASRQVRALGKELRLVVICDRAPEGAQFPVEFVPWSLETEAEALARGDIGIAPTPENRFTLGKCGFKIVQCMAAGLPVVASPVGANVDLITGAAGEEPAGLLPASWEEWPGAIATLAGNLDLRRKMGATGRARVERELSVEAMAARWAEVLG
jgi:glycosyltransferase involved in cell wall biosynthesis